MGSPLKTLSQNNCLPSSSTGERSAPSPPEGLDRPSSIRSQVPHCVASHLSVLSEPELADSAFVPSASLVAVQEHGESAFDPAGKTRKQ